MELKHRPGHFDLESVNAALSAFCVVVTIFMIKHKELPRPDEGEMKKRAEEAYMNERKGNISDVEATAHAGGSMELTEPNLTPEQRNSGIEQIYDQPTPSLYSYGLQSSSEDS